MVFILPPCPSLAFRGSEKQKKSENRLVSACFHKKPRRTGQNALYKEDSPKSELKDAGQSSNIRPPNLQALGPFPIQDIG